MRGRRGAHGLAQLEFFRDWVMTCDIDMATAEKTKALGLNESVSPEAHKSPV